MRLIEEQKMKCVRLWMSYYLVGVLFRLIRSAIEWEPHKLITFIFIVVLVLSLLAGVIISYTINLKAVYPSILISQAGFFLIMFTE